MPALRSIVAQACACIGVFLACGLVPATAAPAAMRDLAPYIAKIKAAGADAATTGNWGNDLALLVKAAREQGYGKDFRYLRFLTLTEMFATALAKAGDAHPQRVALALEGMRISTPTGEVEMRSLDHQLIQPLYMSTLAPVAAQGGPPEVLVDTENSGFGFRTDARIEGYATAQPTSCVMTRPVSAPRGQR